MQKVVQYHGKENIWAALFWHTQYAKRYLGDVLVVNDTVPSTLPALAPLSRMNGRQPHTHTSLMKVPTHRAAVIVLK